MVRMPYVVIVLGLVLVVIMVLLLVMCLTCCYRDGRKASHPCGS